jgi:2-hydroxychromene-2-carboxylate isomerase
MKIEQFKIRKKITFLVGENWVFFELNIEPTIFFDGIKNPKIKEELKNVTQEAHDKEIFGAPSFFVNNKIFWGQDRLEFALDEYNK